MCGEAGEDVESGSDTGITHFPDMDCIWGEKKLKTEIEAADTNVGECVCQVVSKSTQTGCEIGAQTSYSGHAADISGKMMVCLVLCGIDDGDAVGTVTNVFVFTDAMHFLNVSFTIYVFFRALKYIKA